MIKSLTSLRGIFILFIFFHHCLELYPGGGTMAVAFFFVLGGFSMTLGYKDKVLLPEFNYKQYITKRCVKFYPLHWMCLFVVLPLTFIHFNIHQIPTLLINAALLHSWIPIIDVYFSFNWVSWYLADTIFFAFMFPMVFKWIITSKPNGRIIIASLIAVLYISIATSLPVEQYKAILYISPYMRLADFIFGIYLALLYLWLKDKPDQWWNGKYVGQLLIMLFIILLIIESCCISELVSFISPVYWILVALLILLASLQGRNGGGYLFENRYLYRLGELSFIFFMIHQLVLRYSAIILKLFVHLCNLGNNIYYILYVTFTLVLTIVLSLVVERYILNPITKWLTKKIQPSMTARS